MIPLKASPDAVHSDDDDRWHPAISIGIFTIHYWPNIKCRSYDEAAERAQLALNDAQEHLDSFTKEWNLIKL